MQAFSSMCPAPGTGRILQGLRLGLIPFCCLMLPLEARAQLSPGGMATAAIQDTGPAPGGGLAQGGGGTGPGPRNMLPGLFDQFSLYGELSERYTTNGVGSSVANEPDWDTRGT